MMNEKRVNEIISQITAFSNETYTKSEFLPELLKLQKEVVDLTFNYENAENGDRRLWDVERHWRKMNERHGYIADDELAMFVQSNKVVINNICAEKSGNNGEQKIFRLLDELNCENTVLHNVELEFDGKRTEIDAIVFTNYAIFIVEIKNSKKGIFIDENGEFYRCGHSMTYECNIADKMDERAELLRKALNTSGMEYLKIFNVLAFTNDHVDIENKYRYIKVCTGRYLIDFIENFKSNQWYNHNNICSMVEAVNRSKCAEAYRMTINMDEYKMNFANLMTKLEDAADFENKVELNDETPDNIIAPELKNNKDIDVIQKYKNGIAAAVCFTLVNVAFIGISRLLKSMS